MDYFTKINSAIFLEYPEIENNFESSIHEDVYTDEYKLVPISDKIMLNVLKILQPLNFADQDNEDIFDLYNELFNNVMLNINNSETFYQRKYYEIILDSIKYDIESKISSLKSDIEFIYPEFSDKDFNRKIFLKKEFNKLRYDKDFLEKQKVLKNFRPSSTQTFVQKYLSPNTPYNGLLVWHGVGVGKTCSAILAAEEYKEYLNTIGKKIIVLLPSKKTLEKTWKEEVFNIEKEINKPEDINNLQCTGSIYTNLYNKYKSNQTLTTDQIKRKIDRHINKYYEFWGYQEFSNKILKVIEGIHKRRYFTKQELIIDYIKDEFSKCFFIIDEAHGIRPSESKKAKTLEADKDKDVIFILNLITRYANDCKILLLSATPMFDKANEIIDLINILLLNDKRSPIITDMIFNKDNEFKTKESSDIFEYKTRGYISYARGENVHTFPLRLYPNDENVFIPNPDIGFKGKTISEKLPSIINESVFFYRSIFSDDHFDFYNIISQSKTDGFAFDNALESSTIVFPSETDNLTLGNSGFSKCIQKTGYLSYEFKKCAYVNGFPFLHINNLGNYSPKILSIIKCIEKSKGIIFVYSSHISIGVVSIGIALEQLGYQNYIGDGNVQPLIKNNKQKIKPNGKKFVILYGETKNVDQLRQEINKEENKNGENIKIILGTDAVQQGISFKCVREIHILEPWHNISKLDQAVGRGFRNKSHMRLEENKRNLTVYYHVNSSKDGVSETIDEYMYRRAYEKDRNISKIARFLKQNAVDCNLNKDGNMTDIGTDIKPQINSRDELIQSEFLNIYGNGSRSCDYLDCQFVCKADTKEGLIDLKSFNLDVVNFNNIDVCIDLIKFAFWERNIYNVEELKNKILALDNTVSSEEIYLALDKIINEKEPITHNIKGNNYQGYLVYINGYYIFNADNIKENSSYQHRVMLPTNKRKNISIKKIKTLKLLKDTKPIVKKSVNEYFFIDYFVAFMNDIEKVTDHVIRKGDVKLIDKIINDRKYIIIENIINIMQITNYKNYNKININYINFNLLVLGNIFYELDLLTYEQKLTLLSSSLKYIIANNNIDSNYASFTSKQLSIGNYNIIDEIFTLNNPELSVAKIVLLFFDKLKEDDITHNIFWLKRDDIDDKVSNDNPYIFRLYNGNETEYYDYYKYELSTSSFIKQSNNTLSISLNIKYDLKTIYDEESLRDLLYLFWMNSEKKLKVNNTTKHTVKKDKRAISRGKNITQLGTPQYTFIANLLIYYILNTSNIDNISKLINYEEFVLTNILEKNAKSLIELKSKIKCNQLCRRHEIILLSYLIKIFRFNDDNLDIKNKLNMLTSEESFLFDLTKK